MWSYQLNNFNCSRHGQIWRCFYSSINVLFSRCTGSAVFSPNHQRQKRLVLISHSISCFFRPVDHAHLVQIKRSGSNTGQADAPRALMTPLYLIAEITMLELRPNCECCDNDLPPESTSAYICSFECTFCVDCVTQRLQGRCPNCGESWCAAQYAPNQPSFGIPPPACADINNKPVCRLSPTIRFAACPLILVYVAR